MKIVNNIFVLISIFLSISFANAMEKHQLVTQQSLKILTSALNGYVNQGYFSSKSAQEIEIIIDLANQALKRKDIIVTLSKTVKNFPHPYTNNPESIQQMLNNLIYKATQKLSGKKAKVSNQKKDAPASQPNGALQSQFAGNQVLFYRFIEAEIAEDNAYIATRPISTYQSVISSTKRALENNDQWQALKTHFKISRKQLKEILISVLNKATSRLKRAEDEAHKIVQENKAQEREPASQEASSAHKNEPNALKVKPIEEIQPNRLYIGLDVKAFNSKDQRIMWQEPIDIISSKIKGYEFIPNDYFHITIAWYETKNPISADTIAQVERALAHASAILRIVFPEGVRVAGLHDGAVLLGKNKDSVTFRVAASEDLWKLQAILLQFLAFEKMELFKFSTFEKETPLHVTLGKIRPQKMAAQFNPIVEHLNAPEGARASQGQGFVINTFRLTYSSAGQAWQEKMSYKF